MTKSNFIINNKVDSDVATVDIIGEIGESWFSEGITMNSIRNELKEIKKPITFNVSSLGGNGNDAVGIHDIIKSLKVETTSKIIGFTASSGTIVAAAANKREISENAMFLTHNSFTTKTGNSKELRKAADQLDIWDNIASNIYAGNTDKKTKEDFLGLMAEERWISAEEAKEDWGFVDTINIAKNAISNKIYNKINESSLPNIKNTTTMNLWDKVKDYFNSEETAVEEIKNFKTDKAGFETKIETLEASVTTEKDKYTVLKTDTDQKITDFDADKIVEAKKLTDLQAKFDEMEGAYNSLKANPHQVEAEGDPVIDNETDDKTGKQLLNLFSDSQKRALKTNTKNK